MAANNNTPTPDSSGAASVVQGALGTSRIRYWPRLLAWLAVTILAIGILLQLVDFREVMLVLRQSNPWFIILALVLYASSYILRALRVQRLYPQEHLPLNGLWQVMALHNLMNYLMPLRTGDLSLIYFLKRRFGVAIGTGTGIWIVTRALDLLVSLLYLTIALGIYQYRGGREGSGFVLAIAVVLGSLTLLGLLLLPWVWGLGLRLLNFVQARLPFLRRPIVTSLFTKLEEAGVVIRAPQHRRQLVELTLISVALWATLFGFYAAVLQASGIAMLSLPEIVIGSSGAVIANFLPINSFASIGTLEAGWVAGFSLIGMSPSVALLSGIAAHIWIIVFAVGLAVAGIVYDALRARLRHGR